jgi:hypothetical protein
MYKEIKEILTLLYSWSHVHDYISTTGADRNEQCDQVRTHAFRKNDHHRFHHQPSHLISHHISNNDKDAGIITTTEEADNETAWHHASSSWIHGSHGMKDDDAETKAMLGIGHTQSRTHVLFNKHYICYADDMMEASFYVRHRSVVAGVVGLLEHGGLRGGGGLGGERDGDAVLDLLRGVGVLLGGDGVEVGGGALAEEVAVAVSAGVAQRVLQRLQLAPEEGAAHVAQGAQDAAQRPDARDDRVRVALPVAGIIKYFYLCLIIYIHAWHWFLLASYSQVPVPE